eukprot:TRINITY_DN100334_c0_g1_i1.p1 TRINITY_DN100334_c0_g1~~TRINITY_DN100334_c0_g1_i1.p1  ORF type:complete len:135 (+),score=26.40 TRINITY_DN100334_c0_g1_i1:65-469(+)
MAAMELLWKDYHRTLRRIDSEQRLRLEREAREAAVQTQLEAEAAAAAAESAPASRTSTTVTAMSRARSAGTLSISAAADTGSSALGFGSLRRMQHLGSAQPSWYPAKTIRHPQSGWWTIPEKKRPLGKKPWWVD